MSGLKINYTKSKVIWIGRKKFSKEVYHHKRWKLGWGDSEFTLLGIKFSTNLKDISEINFGSKIIAMKKLMNIWSSRNLTVIGRIIILKTLVLPKITHLIMALPDPPDNTINTLNTLFFKFIWQNKPDKVKRDLIIQNYRNGGLNMINISNYITSLKCTWIRRLHVSNAKWTTLFTSITGMDRKEL